MAVENVQDIRTEKKRLRFCASKNLIIISDHAMKRMGERSILLPDVMKAVEKGCFIEAQDVERDLKLLFQEHRDPPRFTTVVACKPTRPVLVTVYPFDPARWVYQAGKMRRRQP